MTCKAASPEWEPEQKWAQQQVQAAAQAVLPLRPYDPADPMIVEVSIVGKDAVWRLWEAQVGGPWASGARPCHRQQRITCLLRNKS